MNRTSDLDHALSFVTSRIAEQAKLSGEPLNHYQHTLLDRLPVHSAGTSWNLENQILVPRNPDLERLCALTKSAIQQDRDVNPGSLDWEFAFAALTLAKHPMRGLLQLVGMKPRRPKWDGLLLFISAVSPIFAAILLAWNSGGSLLLSAAIVATCLATLLSAFFASKRLEKRRLEEEIERCRLSSRFGVATHR
jgi:hypothetical protein